MANSEKRTFDGTPIQVNTLSIVKLGINRWLQQFAPSQPATTPAISSDTVSEIHQTDRKTAPEPSSRILSRIVPRAWGENGPKHLDQH